MNSNQIALNLEGGYGLQRRLSSSGSARSPGSVQTTRPEEVPGRGDYSRIKGLAGEDQLSKGLVGRVATVEWQQKVELSSSIGVADQVMGEIYESLQEAKRDLSEIIKIFPPYPHGSEERAELLNSYRSLRLQIDKMVFPPENDMAAQILGGDKDGSLPLEFQGFRVDSGSAGLDLVVPQVSVDGPEDKEIPALIDDLERASGVLKERRMNLRITAAATFNQESGEEAFYVNLSFETRERLAAFDATLGRPETGIHNDLPNIYGE